MRYGNAHNVHKKNKDTDFTRQPEDINEMLGNFQKEQIGVSIHPSLKRATPTKVAKI